MRRLLHVWILPLTLLGTVVCAAFLPWLLHGLACAPLDIPLNLYEPWADTNAPVRVKNHFPTDATEHYLLYRDFASRSFRSESRLGWNPLKSCGVADYANTMATAFDWTFQLHRFLPFWTAWNLGLMGQLLLAAVGMCVLLRGFGHPVHLGLTGAFAYAFCSPFAGWLYHRWNLGGFCWMPWALWALHQARAGRRAGLLAPAFLALAFLGTHLQFAAFVLLAVACCLAGWLWEDGAKTATVVRNVAVLVPPALIGVGLAALMFIPCSIAYFLTMKAGLVRGHLGYPEGPLMPVLNLLAFPTFVFPFAMGSPNTLTLYRLVRMDVMNVPFFGSALVCLAFCGLFVRGLNRTAKTLVLAGLILPLTPLVGPLYHRLFVFAVLGGVWLAIDLIAKTDDRQFRPLLRGLMIVFAVGSAVLLLASLVLLLNHTSALHAFKQAVIPELAAHRLGALRPWFEERVERFLREWPIWHPRTLLPWSLFGASLVVLRRRQGRTFRVLFPLLTLLQVACFFREWIVFCPPPSGPHCLYPLTEEVALIQEHAGPATRVSVDQADGRLPLFPPNTLTHFGISIPTAYDSILPFGIQAGLAWKDEARSTEKARELGKRAVAHLVTYRDRDLQGEGWVKVGAAGDIAIYSNTFARAWYQASRDDGREGAALRPDVHDFNYRRLRLPAGTRRVALIENWDEGWRYRVREGPWRRMTCEADRSMSAAVSPPSAEGDSYEMTFRPRTRQLGQGVSAFFVLVYLAYALASGRARRGPGRPTQEH